MARKVVISYRKGLHAVEAERLQAALEKRLRRVAILLDADQTTARSAWADAIASFTPGQTALLVIASESLIDQRAETGLRLLQSPDDPMRRELEAALAQKIAIVPVVVDGANPLSVARLPDELWPVFLQPAARFREDTAEEDADRLAARIAEALAPQPKRVSLKSAAAVGFVALLGGAALGAGLLAPEAAAPPIIISDAEEEATEDVETAALAVEGRLARLETELTAARAALREARADFAAERAALTTELATAEDALANARADAPERAAALEDELERLRAAAAASERALTAAIEAREAANARAAAEETARRAAETRAAEAEQTAAALAAQSATASDATTAESANAALAAARREAEAAEAAAAAARADAAEAAAREAAAAADAEATADAVAGAEAEIEAARAALEAAEARVATLTRQANRLRAVTPNAIFEFTTTDAKARTVRAQEALIALGYDIGAVDGLIGARTGAALTSFQDRAGLPETGAVDEETLDALIIAEWYYGASAEARSASAAPSSAPRPTRRARRPGDPEQRTAEAQAFTAFRDCRACPIMTRLPSGAYLMGSPETEADRVADEGPRRTVRVARFAIGKYEVTVGEWRACVADGFCRAVDATGRDDAEPIVGVAWTDVTGEGVAEQGFVAWLNSKTDGAPYRLPSEAEWEYAARAGADSAYAFGDDPAALDAYAWFNANSARGAAPVGSKAPNSWGLYDMHGNVWEWVRDCWHPNYAEAPTDGTAWMAGGGGECARAVTRGGAWNDLPWALRAAYRGWSTRDRRRGDVGFRVARSL